MDVMVTGGTGFIGSHIVQSLVTQGHHVTILARNPTKVAGFVGVPEIDFVQGTLRDCEAICEALAGQDACIHVALGWGDTAVEMAEADTVPSLFIFDEAVRAGVGSITYTSSIAAFGDARRRFSEDTTTRPNNLYAATKAATESYLLALGASEDIRVNIVRPGYTFGEPAVPGASIYTDTKLANLVDQARRNETIRVTKDEGTQFIWVGDLARIYLAVLSSDVTRRLYTGVSTDFTTWAEVAQMAVDHLGSASTVVADDLGVDPDMALNDVSPIEEDYGLSFVSKDRLRVHVAWLAERQARLVV
jgi:UDP-glucose 4-epimerase